MRVSLMIFAGVWVAVVVLALFLPDRGGRKVLGWLLPFFGIGFSLAFGPFLAPWERLVFMTFGLLYLIKGTVLLQYSQKVISGFSKKGILLYMTLWPGMSPGPFRSWRPQILESEEGLTRGFIYLVLGSALAVITAFLEPTLGALGGSWLGLFALLLMIHFGVSDLLVCGMRLAGWNVKPLFRFPFRASSLEDFWSHRWNLAFVEMDRILFLKPFSKWLGIRGAILCIFVISGFLHEMAISYSTGRGWGLPFLYFIVQGIALLIEKDFLEIENHWPKYASRIWTWCWVILPLPLLFHVYFLEEFILPLYSWLHSLMMMKSITWWFDLALWLAAIGTFCTLGAGLQAPIRLKWKEDFAKLAPFNRKIFYTYYGTIGFIIISFGILSLVLHEEMLSGSKPALCLAGFMGSFWTFRILVDFFYFSHKDWPQGACYLMGHILLTSLFIAMASVYLGLVAWHVFFI